MLSSAPSKAERVPLDDHEFRRRQRTKNLLLGGLLLALAVLFYLVTLVRLGGV